MPRVNSAAIEAEMKILAETKVEQVAGDAVLLTTKETAAVWGRSVGWVKTMQAAGRVPTVPFGALEKVPRAVAVMGLVKGV